MKNLIIHCISLLLVLGLFLTGCTSQADREAQALAARILEVENGLQPNLQIEGDSIPRYNLEARMRALGIPGVSIAVVNDGEIEWARGYGMADSAEQRPVTTETLFLAGSISKPVAATRAHQLVEAGTVHLDSNINNYLTSWKVPDNEFTVKEKVTLRRILNHTAGLTVWGFPGYDQGDTIPHVIEVLDGLGNTDAVRVYKEPGASWMYSGGGYTVMQLMITDLEQQSFPEIMQTHVLDALGMMASTFANPLPESLHPLAATGYRANGDEVEGKWPIYPEMAAAGLWTTPSQLILWAREIQHILQHRQDGLLKTTTVREMLTPGLNGHGLGPGIKEHTFGHGGADEGFRAQLVAWKETPQAVVVMVNSDKGSIIQEILLSIAAAYDLPGIEPRTRTVIDMEAERLQRFAGTYHFPDLGDARMQVKARGLEVSGDFLNKPIHCLPSSDSTFFDTEDGEYFHFSFAGDTVNGVEVQGFSATKIE